MVPLLMQGDCLEAMSLILDSSVDLVIADLPYGATALEWDTEIPADLLWAHYRRILKPNGAVVLTAINPFAARLIMSNIDWFRYEWVWEKTSAKGHMSAALRPLRAHELVLVFSPKRTTYNPQKWQIEEEKRTKRKTLTMTGSVGAYGHEQKQRKLDDGSRFPRSVVKFGNAPSKVASRNFHPTQKPVELMEYLVRTYSNPGEVVLDNVMGSGTTGVACVNTGRHFIGIEKDPTHFATAQRRIREAGKAPGSVGAGGSASERTQGCGPSTPVMLA